MASILTLLILRNTKLTLKGRGGGHNGPPPPTLKPLYFEKLPHWPNLKILDFSWNIVRKLFAKVLGLEISCLEGAWMSRVAKHGRIWPNNTTLRTDKDLKSKKEEKSLYISQGYRFKKIIWNQSQKKFGLKKAFFLGHPNSGSCVQNA